MGTAIRLALVLFLVPAAAGARCLAYEPAVVTLVGQLEARTLPGPPNYANIARGDIPEVVVVLRLEQAVCVSGDPAKRFGAKSHAGLLEVQIAAPQERVRSFVGKRVRVSGTLFGAQSRHHHTPVVLQLARIGAA